MKRTTMVLTVASVVSVVGLCGALGWAADADEPQQTAGMAQVFLADGTSVALSGWSLSYEYQAVPPGASRGLVRPARREARELWLGKEALPLVGRTLEIRYKAVPVEGGAQQAQEAESLALTSPDGKTKQLRLEAPVLNRLRGSEPKDNVIYPLGLRGVSLMGTARQFCLATFTAFGECRPADGERVVRVVFVN